MELSSNPNTPLDPYIRDLLRYLEHGFPKYPFDRKLDTAFVVELVADFERLDLLEQIKTFRWCYNDDLWGGPHFLDQNRRQLRWNLLG